MGIAQAGKLVGLSGPTPIGPVTDRVGLESLTDFGLRSGASARSEVVPNASVVGRGMTILPSPHRVQPTGTQSGFAEGRPAPGPGRGDVDSIWRSPIMQGYRAVIDDVPMN
jgi:hypothetical protein